MFSWKCILRKHLTQWLMDVKRNKYHMYICTCTCRGTYVHVMFEYTIYELYATMYTCICVYHNKHNKVNSNWLHVHCFDNIILIQITYHRYTCTCVLVLVYTHTHILTIAQIHIHTCTHIYTVAHTYTYNLYTCKHTCIFLW